MAIARAVRPSVIVAGGVTRTRELRRKTDQSVYGNEVIVGQDSGAQIGVTIYLRDGVSVAPIPSVGEFFACEATVEESREFGASLNYAGTGASTLDQIYSSLASASK